MKGAAQMFTVSLVTYRHRLSDISAVVKAVLASGCAVFYVVDNSSMPELAADLAALGDSRIIYIPSENRGFGAGHNLAVNRALAEGCDQHFIVNPDIDFIYTHIFNNKEFTLDTRELRAVLGDEVKFSEPSVAVWIGEYISENLTEIYGGANL